VGIPFALSKTPASIRTPPPTLGEHTDEILGEAGYTRAEIETLRERGVI
jgi:crotonobetainyl-CoA:carnitine CoA-transferase CaiB-like acyl-CoA transferase